MTHTPILTDVEIAKKACELVLDRPRDIPALHALLAFARAIESLLLSRLSAGAESAYLSDGKQAFPAETVRSWPKENAVRFTVPLFAAPVQSVPAGSALSRSLPIREVDGESYVRVEDVAPVLASLKRNAVPEQAGPTDAEMLDWLEAQSCECLSVKLFGSRVKQKFGVERWGDDDATYATTLRDALRAAMSATSDAGGKP